MFLNQKGINTSNYGTENIQDLIVNELSIFTLNHNESNDSQLNSVDKLRIDSFENGSPKNPRIVEELIKRLAGESTPGAAYFSLFVCGAENNKKLLEVASSIHGSLVDPVIKEEFTKDPEDGLLKNLIVGTISLEHVVATKSITAIKYVLEASERIGINVSISDKSIEKLLISYKDSKCTQIINLLLKYQVVLAFLEKEIKLIRPQSEATNLTSIIEDHIDAYEIKNKILKLRPSK